MTRRIPSAVAGLLLVMTTSGGARQAGPGEPSPVEPVTAIIDAFRTHDVVMLADPHGRVQMQAFLLGLIRDPRLPGTVQDIVIEPGSARYQDVVDRFVRGDEVDYETLRRAWEDATVPNSLGVHTQELIRTVRSLNASLATEKRLRVLLGDPPIDWDHVTSADDHFRWIALRDSYPADLIRRQVLDRGRRALVLYGQMHAQRKQVFSNYDMSTWQAQTIASLLETDAAAKVFTVWTFFDEQFLPDSVRTWPSPGLALVRGTTLGAADFATYVVVPNRFAMEGGRLRPVPSEQWRALGLAEQFDAVLFLGSPASMTLVPVPPTLCADERFMRTRFERIRLAGLPPVETAQLRAACGL